jgi:hypothetical protein
MYNFSRLIAASEKIPGNLFSFKLFDSTVLVHHLPVPEGSKSTVGRTVYSIVWIPNLVNHDASFCQSSGFTDLSG